MKKFLLTLITALGLVGGAHASSGGMAWDKAPVDVTNQASLQNGAKIFVNYCLNCHSAAFMRYNRMRDIGLTEEQIKDNLIFTGAKVGETMKTALDPKDAKEWFGGVPPDLSLVTRSRADGSKGSGADYVYTYLRSYYRDDSRPTGWNNTAFPGVGMPNVLWELQGQQGAVFETEKDPHDPAKTHAVFKGFQPLTEGKLSTAEYNEAVADLVAFMQWMAEPHQSQRVRLGVFVLLFLALFTLIAWRLNAAYWKDIK